MTEKTKKSQGAGLAGIVAGDSAISTVGIGMGLNYRGYDISDLAKNSTFEDVSYLILYGKLPSAKQLEDFIVQIVKARALPSKLKEILERIPVDVHPMDMMRTVSSYLGLIEPETKEND